MKVLGLPVAMGGRRPRSFCPARPSRGRGAMFVFVQVSSMKTRRRGIDQGRVFGPLLTASGNVGNGFAHWRPASFFKRQTLLVQKIPHGCDGSAFTRRSANSSINLAIVKGRFHPGNAKPATHDGRR